MNQKFYNSYETICTVSQADTTDVINQNNMKVMTKCQSDNLKMKIITTHNCNNV